MGRVHPIRGLPIVALLGCAFLSPAWADRIVVRNGPAIKGKAILDDAHPDQYLVFGERGKTPIVLKRDRVARIDPEPSVLDDYVLRRKAIATIPAGTSGAQAEYDLGLWCEGHKLPDLASVHYEGSIKRDRTFGPAHRKLGHVEHDGQWLTPAELKAEQGYILYRGKWITPEEKVQRDAEESATAEQQSWMRRLAIIRQAIVSGIESRGHDAEAQLLAIRETAAVNPIVRTFGNDPDPSLRKLAARALVSIPGPEASAALVARLLAEADEEVRTATLAELAKSKESNVVRKLAQGLQSKSLAVINRAAWSLGNLNAVEAVPKLIPALISSEIQVAWVPSPGSPGSGFGSMPPGSSLGLSGGRSIPILTGPTVGTGAVAYGATSVNVSNFGGGFGVNINPGDSGTDAAIRRGQAPQCRGPDGLDEADGRGPRLRRRRLEELAGHGLSARPVAEEERAAALIGPSSTSDRLRLRTIAIRVRFEVGTAGEDAVGMADRPRQGCRGSRRPRIDRRGSGPP